MYSTQPLKTVVSEGLRSDADAIKAHRMKSSVGGCVRGAWVGLHGDLGIVGETEETSSRFQDRPQKGRMQSTGRSAAEKDRIEGSKVPGGGDHFEFSMYGRNIALLHVVAAGNDGKTAIRASLWTEWAVNVEAERCHLVPGLD